MTEDLLGPLGDKLQPGLVSPLVTYLCHESCESTGRVYSVGGGRVAEVFIAECQGYTTEATLARETSATTGTRSPTRTATGPGQHRRGDGDVPRRAA